MPRVNHVIDRLVVVNHAKARALLAAVAVTPRRGHLLVAFCASMYYSALRLEEAASLALHNLELACRRRVGVDDPGAGLARDLPETDQHWGDTGGRRVERQLKHRAVGDTRRVPVPPN